jgi:hypothetical protein
MDHEHALDLVLPIVSMIRPSLVVIADQLSEK